MVPKVPRDLHGGRGGALVFFVQLRVFKGLELVQVQRRFF